jgi:hypothetical protein
MASDRTAYLKEYYSRPEVRDRITKYRKSPEGKAARRKYLASAKGKAASKRNHTKYMATSKGTAAHKRAYKKYMGSDQGVATRRTYTHSTRRHAQDRISRLSRVYGLTAGELSRMEAAQRGVCAICGKPNSRRKHLVVDHDHKSGRVRQLLCDGCNLILGYAQDSTTQLQSCIAYLTKHNSVTEPEYSI